MTAKLTSNLGAFLASLPGNLESKVVRGGLKAGADVIAAGAREECRSEEVRATIKTSSKIEPGVVTATVKTEGPGAYKAPWLENGTDPHFIAVDDEAAGGRTVQRVNRLDKKAEAEGRNGPGGSLVINGKFVGSTVHHPGATPHPFMRPALDSREQEAITAIGEYIGKRLTKEGLTAPAAPEEPDE